MTPSDEARAAFEDGRHEFAGDSYTQRAYSALSHDAIVERRDGPVAAGLHYLLRAAVCYELAGQPKRTANRCRQGVLIAADIRKHPDVDTAREGILYEYTGDFRVLGGLDGSVEAYEEARDRYADAGLSTSFEWPSNPLVDKLVTFLTWLHVQAGEPVPDDMEIEYGFANRLEYKRAKLAALLQRLSESTGSS